VLVPQAKPINRAIEGGVEQWEWRCEVALQARLEKEDTNGTA